MAITNTRKHECGKYLTPFFCEPIEPIRGFFYHALGYDRYFICRACGKLYRNVEEVISPEDLDLIWIRNPLTVNKLVHSLADWNSYYLEHERNIELLSNA